VDWFNAVDATYRADLRELNELNFQRFDAKVEQRFAEADAKLERRFAQADVKLEQRFAHAEAKVEQRFAEFDAKIERRFVQADAKLDTSVAALREEIRTGLVDRHVSVLKWMFTFWIATLVPLAGLILAMR
jgi:CRP-like cAMP-binding protein